jgi:hypothetical protein
MYTEYGSADPVADMKIFGTIVNSDVRRRDNVKPDILKRIAKDNAVAAKGATEASLKGEIKPKTESLAPSAATAPKLKTQTSAKGGALFSSFAKAKPKAQGVTKPPAKEIKDEDGMYLSP